MSGWHGKLPEIPFIPDTTNILPHEKQETIGIFSVLIVIVLFRFILSLPPTMRQTDSRNTSSTTSACNIWSSNEYTNAILAFDSALATNTTFIAKSDTLQYIYEGKGIRPDPSCKRYDDALERFAGRGPPLCKG